MNLFTCGCLKRVYTESMRKSVVFRYCEKHSPEVAIDRDPFDITRHEFSDFKVLDAEVSANKRKLRLNFDSLDFHYADLSKDDAIAIAKALGVTAEDLK